MVTITFEPLFLMNTLRPGVHFSKVLKTFYNENSVVLGFESLELKFLVDETCRQACGLDLTTVPLDRNLSLRNSFRVRNVFGTFEKCMPVVLSFFFCYCCCLVRSCLCRWLIALLKMATKRLVINMFVLM